jgi:hypothetical protein
MPRIRLTDLSVRKWKLPLEGHQTDIADDTMAGLMLRISDGGCKR